MIWQKTPPYRVPLDSDSELDPAEQADLEKSAARYNEEDPWELFAAEKKRC